MFVLAVAVCVAATFLMYCAYYPLKYQNYIAEYSSKFNISPALVCAVINAESSFDKDAVSNKGAVGLMQIMPSTAKAISAALDENFDESNLFDVKTNIKYGSFYLSQLLKQFEFDEALCAYNAGMGKVLGWLKNPQYSTDGQHLHTIPYPQTKAYVEKVKKNINFYQNKII